VAKTADWVRNVRDDPKGALEADLSVSGLGLAITLFGGVITVAGVHPRWESIHDNRPAPFAGTVVVMVGMFVIALGLALFVLSSAVWLAGRAGRRDAVLSPVNSCPNGRAVRGPSLHPPATGSAAVCPGGGSCGPLPRVVVVGTLLCAAGPVLGTVGLLIGGGPARALWGVALVSFAVGVWLLAVTGGLAALLHRVGFLSRTPHPR